MQFILNCGQNRSKVGKRNLLIIFINKTDFHLGMRSPEIKSPKIAIVILNWNGKKDTKECLNSLKQITYSNYEIILVDNGSVDGSVEMLEKEHQEIVLIKNKENLGFTGGNNVGIKKALEHNADYVLLLNNDTTVEQDFLEKMVGVAEQDASIGIVGPKIYYYSLPYIIWSAGGKYIHFLGKARTNGINKTDSPEYNVQREVSWVTGCAMMIKREVFEKIGLLEEQYFSNYEDLDFCISAERARYTIYYAPEAVIYHKVARDWGGLDNPLYIYYQIRNNLLFIERKIKFPENIIPLLFLLFVSIPRRSLALVMKGEGGKIRYLLYGIEDFFMKKFYKTERPFIKKQKKKEQLSIGINIRFIQTTISGIGKYVLELVKALAQKDAENKYYLYEYNHTKVIYPVEKENFSYVVPKFSTKVRSMRIFLEQFLFSWYIKKQELDVFHGPSFMLPVFKPKGTKCIITVHDLTFLRYPESFTFETKIYYKLFFKRSIDNADMIIADSEATKDDLMLYFHVPKNKIKVVYLGVDKAFTQIVDKSSVEEVQKKYTLPKKFFLFTGLLSPRKNIEGALRAFNSLRADVYKDYHFVIVGGKGWLYESIFRFVQEHNLKERVHFTGYIDAADLPVLYTLAEALVFPSFYEGFGLPILEAMACGCPVITSNVSSMPEVAGDAALLIDPKNTQEIADAMEKMVSGKKLRKQLVEKGYEQAKKFTWEKTAEETLALYKQVANV